MSILNEEQVSQMAIDQVAKMMMVAARTAPKGRGRNTIEVKIVNGEHLDLIANEMEKIAVDASLSFFKRDAENIRNSSAMVLIGTWIESLGLGDVCGYCGFKNCDEKNLRPEIPCVFNVSDLNLALGSAVEIASKFHVDNRIMFSAGKAAININIFDQNIKIALAIPLAAKSKNPFFDRK